MIVWLIPCLIKNLLSLVLGAVSVKNQTTPKKSFALNTVLQTKGITAATINMTL